MDKLKEHVKLTIITLEKFLARRGWTTGLKEWERKLLYSAYEANETPIQDRKFGLDKIKDESTIGRVIFPEDAK